MSDDAVIYRFEPYKWNRLSLPRAIKSDRDVIHCPDLKNGNFIDAWGYMNELRRGKFSIKGRKLEFSPVLPIAIAPPYLNPRMKMQQSQFLLFGSKRLPADKIHQEKDLFEKFKVPSLYKKEICEILSGMGYTSGSVYQTLDHIVQDLMEQEKHIFD